MLGRYDIAPRLDEIRAAYADALPVAQGAKRVVEVLTGMPLATQTRLAAALRLSAADLHRPMTELREKGLVDSVTLGGSAQESKPAPRWFFTEQAIEMFGNLPVTLAPGGEPWLPAGPPTGLGLVLPRGDRYRLLWRVSGVPLAGRSGPGCLRAV